MVNKDGEEIGIIDGGNTRMKHTTDYVKVPTRCKYCDEINEKHLKCKDCKILIHSESYMCECGVAHTLSEDLKRCVACIQDKKNGPKVYDLVGLSLFLGIDL